LAPSASNAGATGDSLSGGEGGTGGSNVVGDGGAGVASGASGGGGQGAFVAGGTGGVGGKVSNGAGGVLGGGAAGRSVLGGAGSGLGGASVGGATPTSGGAAGTSSGGHANGGAAGTASSPTFQGCATWNLETARGATSTITLTDGGVLLFRPGDANNTQTVYNTTDIALSQPGLSGDFDIVVSYDNFQPGDAQPFWGPEFQAGAYLRESSGYVYEADGRVGAGDGVMAVRVPNDDTPIGTFSPIPDSLVGASGSIEIARKDGIMTSAVTINGVTNSVSSTTPFYEDGFVFFVGIGLSGEAVGPADASVRITSIKVEGGGGAVMSDAFDCTP
jgi:hypothetical protein